MTPEERAQKLHTDDASPPKSVLLIVHGLRKICINQSEVLARSWLVTCHQYGVSAFVWQGNLEGDCPITTLFLKFKVSQPTHHQETSWPRYSYILHRMPRCVSQQKVSSNATVSPMDWWLGQGFQAGHRHQ